MPKTQSPPRRYPLSLRDALPISHALRERDAGRLEHRRPDHAVEARDVLADDVELRRPPPLRRLVARLGEAGDRKSTRLNSSHVETSYAGFCLTKKIAHPHAKVRR